MRRITIVGGGFSGASTAVQLARRSTIPLALTIVEPRAAIGYGIAYSSDDLDHRLNGNLAIHFVDPTDPDAFTRWCMREGSALRDPESVSADGSMFVRRREFGRFVAESVAALSDLASIQLTHVRDRATDVIDEGGLTVVTAEGSRLPSDLVVVATGNSIPPLPAAFAPALARHAGVIAAPHDLERIRAIPKDARVLVVGTALTALDVISTMVRARHEGPITAVSRRGLRPRPYRPTDVGIEPPQSTLLERIEGPLAPFVLRAGPHPTARKLLHALRERIREVEAAGGLWYVAFDELRDPLWRLWSALDVREKRAILRHLRTWYDVHRFRAPPQNDAIVRAAEREGRVRFQAARLCSVDASGGTVEVRWIERGATLPQRHAFDVVVNCIGLDFADAMSANPFLAAMQRRGRLALDPTGIGIAVDRECRPSGADGRRDDRVRVVGPPTCGAFGDPLGALFIAAQIRRFVPGMLAHLADASGSA